MMRGVVYGLVAVLFLSTAGCGGHDNLMKELIQDINGLAESIEKKESDDRRKALRDKLKATAEKIDRLKLSEDEKDKLLKKHEGELKAALARLVKASEANAVAAPDVGGIFK